MNDEYKTTAGVVAIKKIQLVTASEIPDGVYLGTWAGYSANTLVGGYLHEFSTDVGIDRTGVTCKIRVSGSDVIVETT